MFGESQFSMDRLNESVNLIFFICVKCHKKDHGDIRMLTQIMFLEK